MPWLLLGLLIFLGSHSLRLFAPDWRQRQLDRLGAPAFKIVYALVAIAGFSLALVGYGQTRRAPVVIWDPPLDLWPLTQSLQTVAGSSHADGDATLGAVAHPGKRTAG